MAEDLASLDDAPAFAEGNLQNSLECPFVRSWSWIALQDIEESARSWYENDRLAACSQICSDKPHLFFDWKMRDTQRVEEEPLVSSLRQP